MTVRIEKFHTPVILPIEEGGDWRDQFLKLTAISEKVDRSDVLVGGKKVLLLPELVRSCIVRAFEGQATSVGEIVLAGLLQSSLIINLLSELPKPNQKGEYRLPLNALSSFHILSKLTDTKQILVYAVIRFL